MSFRATLMALVTIPLAGAAAPLHQSPASPDITGTWKIDGHNPDGTTYGGSLRITPNGECYTIEWTLNSGQRYTGVGMVLRETILAVAWTNAPKEGGWGMVFYADTDEGGFEGWWCQPDGMHGMENLGGPARLAGTHALAEGGNNGSGTVTLKRYRNSQVNYEMSWVTELGNYSGFGTALDKDANIIAGVWGIPSGGGAGLYSLREVEKGRMLGWWAAIGDTRQGEEALKR